MAKTTRFQGPDWFHGSNSTLAIFLSFPCSLVTCCSHQVFGCGKDWFPISLLNFFLLFLSLLATDGSGLEPKYSAPHSSNSFQRSNWLRAACVAMINWQKVRTLNAPGLLITGKEQMLDSLLEQTNAKPLSNFASSALEANFVSGFIAMHCTKYQTEEGCLWKTESNVD